MSDTLKERFGDFVLNIEPENVRISGFWLGNSPHQGEFSTATFKIFAIPLPAELYLWWKFTYSFYLGYHFSHCLNAEEDFERLGLKEIRDTLKCKNEKDYCFENEVWRMMFHEDDVNLDLMERMLKQTIDWVNLFDIS